jgi:hypothetical protein
MASGRVLSREYYHSVNDLSQMLALTSEVIEVIDRVVYNSLDTS